MSHTQATPSSTLSSDGSSTAPSMMRAAIRCLLGATQNSDVTDIDHKGSDGYTALHHACRSKNIDRIVALVLANAKVSIVDSNPMSASRTVLHEALAAALPSAVIELLVCKQASALIADRRGKLAIHYAAESSDRAIFEIVLQAHQAQLLALPLEQQPPSTAVSTESIFATADVKRQTPLHIAARANNLEVVRLLLQRKANVFASDANHQTPLDVASNRTIRNEIEQEATRVFSMYCIGEYSTATAAAAAAQVHVVDSRCISMCL
jgi:ankyrin repeat protein